MWLSSKPTFTRTGLLLVPVAFTKVSKWNFHFSQAAFGFLPPTLVKASGGLTYSEVAVGLWSYFWHHVVLSSSQPLLLSSSSYLYPRPDPYGNRAKDSIHYNNVCWPLHVHARCGDLESRSQESEKMMWYFLVLNVTGVFVIFVNLFVIAKMWYPLLAWNVTGLVGFFFYEKWYLLDCNLAWIN